MAKDKNLSKKKQEKNVTQSVEARAVVEKLNDRLDESRKDNPKEPMNNDTGTSKVTDNIEKEVESNLSEIQEEIHTNVSAYSQTVGDIDPKDRNQLVQRTTIIKEPEEEESESSISSSDDQKDQRCQRKSKHPKKDRKYRLDRTSNGDNNKEMLDRNYHRPIDSNNQCRLTTTKEYDIRKLPEKNKKIRKSTK